MEGIEKIIKNGHAAAEEHDINILSRIWRKAVALSNIDFNAWYSLLEKYQRDEEAKVGKSLPSEKSNTVRKLNNKNLTWNGLMTGLRILGYVWINIEIRLKKKSKYSKPIIITVTAVLDSPNSAVEVNPDNNKNEENESKEELSEALRTIWGMLSVEERTKFLNEQTK